MLIAGARGFAIQLTDVLDQLDVAGDRAYFDDTSGSGALFLNKYPILSTKESAYAWLKGRDKRFCLGTGNPEVRAYFFDLFGKNGGTATSIISPHAYIGRHEIQIGEGSCILTRVVVESTVQIGKGVLVNLGATLTHDCVIGDFCEICPGVHLSGGCQLGAGVFVGTGAVILPKIKIGDKARIGAGAVVTRDVASGEVVTGVPGRLHKKG